MEARATDPAETLSVHPRLALSTANAPTTMRSTRGRSLATVATALSRVPCATPRMLTALRIPKVRIRTAARPAAPSRAGTSAPIESAKMVDTAATARVPSIQTNTPARNPANDPKATST